MFSKQRYLGLAIIVISAAAQANAGKGHPLHPSFYWDAAPQTQAVMSGEKVYVDSGNPLHSAYPRVIGAPDWQPAVESTGTGYRDNNNPLHPSFKR